MKKILDKLFNHAFFAIGIALGVGVLSMVGLVQLYGYFWAEESQESVVENPVERALSEGQPGGPVQTLHIRMPGPFIVGRDETPVGFVLLDVAIDISGEDQFNVAQENLDTLFNAFTNVLKAGGVGRADLPGEVDYDRLAITLLRVARDEVDLKGITSVRVSEDEGT